MIHINDHTVAVESENDLAIAIGDTAIDYIYLAVDITLTSGKTIASNRTALVIDGTYKNVTHLFTDMNSTGTGDTIGIRGPSAMTLTICNMRITGQNYYGIPYVYDFPNTSGLTIVYENIIYTGPQLAFNQKGLTRIIGCDITIAPSAACEAQEVGEVNRVEIGGETRIMHGSTEARYAVFWFYGPDTTASFTVLPGANVSITTTNNYFMYNVVPFLNIPIPVRYTIQAGARFTLNANRGISLNQVHQMASFTVDENASFRYIQASNNGSESALYINGELKVNQGARFYMQAYDNAAPLIRFTNNAARLLTVNNPKSFVLYSRNAAALSFATSTNFALNGGQVNYWSQAKTPLQDAGTFDDIPPRKWFKKEYLLPLALTGSVAQQATTIASDNIAPEDLPLPSLADLHLHDARVLSIGSLPLSVNPVRDDRTPITGLTTPNAKILVEYTLEGTLREIEGTAEADGSFTILISEDILFGTPVKISANDPFLIVSVVKKAEGILSVKDAPTLLRFITPVISAAPLLLGRHISVLQVTVADRRIDSTPWELVVSIDGPMQTASGHTLPDAVVYVDDSGMEPLSTATPLPVYTGGPNVPETVVTWNADKGILLNITEPLYNREAYTARLTWEARPI